MAKKDSLFKKLEAVAEIPKIPKADPKGLKEFTDRYGINPYDPTYDYETAYRIGLKPTSWLDLPEDNRYEDVAEALSGEQKFPLEETKFLEGLTTHLHPRAFNIFDLYMKTRPPVWYWPDALKIKKE